MPWPNVPSNRSDPRSIASLLYEIMGRAYAENQFLVIQLAQQCLLHPDQMGLLNPDAHCQKVVAAFNAAAAMPPDWISCIDGLDHAGSGGGSGDAASEGSAGKLGDLRRGIEELISAAYRLQEMTGPLLPPKRPPGPGPKAGEKKPGKQK